MRIHQRIRRDGVWQSRGLGTGDSSQLVLAFSSVRILAEPDTWHELRALYPAARIVACSTAGEIDNTNV
jgi:hypothetical protein